MGKLLATTLRNLYPIYTMPICFSLDLVKNGISNQNLRFVLLKIATIKGINNKLVIKECS